MERELKILKSHSIIHKLDFPSSSIILIAKIYRITELYNLKITKEI